MRFFPMFQAELQYHTRVMIYKKNKITDGGKS